MKIRSDMFVEQREMEEKERGSSDGIRPKGFEFEEIGNSDHFKAISYEEILCRERIFKIKNNNDYCIKSPEDIKTLKNTHITGDIIIDDEMNNNMGNLVYDFRNLKVDGYIYFNGGGGNVPRDSTDKAAPIFPQIITDEGTRNKVVLISKYVNIYEWPSVGNKANLEFILKRYFPGITTEVIENTYNCIMERFVNEKLKPILEDAVWPTDHLSKMKWDKTEGAIVVNGDLTIVDLGAVKKDRYGYLRLKNKKLLLNPSWEFSQYEPELRVEGHFVFSNTGDITTLPFRLNVLGECRIEDSKINSISYVKAGGMIVKNCPELKNIQHVEAMHLNVINCPELKKVDIKTFLGASLKDCSSLFPKNEPPLKEITLDNDGMPQQILIERKKMVCKPYLAIPQTHLGNL